MVLSRALCSGLLAGGLGLGLLAIPVLLLWISSPYPDSGPENALRTTADLWLLAHGTPLERGTPHGAVPVALTPLLLTALPAVLLYRGARDAVAMAPPCPENRPAPMILAVSGGYLLAGTLACALACTAVSGGALHVTLWRAALQLPLFTLPLAGLGVWAAYGRPLPPLDVDPSWVRRATRATEPWRETALRGAGVGVVALCGGGAALVALATLWHADSVQLSFPQLTTATSGRLAVLLLAVALSPNAAIWAAAYGLGPGFTLGGGSLVAPSQVTELPHLPHFPLLAALPHPGDGGPGPTALAAAVPVLAALALGCCVARARSGGPEGGRLSWPATLTATGTACLLSALAMALLAWCASGALGHHTLAHMGPTPWWTGLATLAWTLLVGVPTACLGRLWRTPRRSRESRGRRPRHAAPARGTDSGRRWWWRRSRRETVDG
ncbi:DUF6350 family protein [Streptomyces sp. NPDC005438]|uniref:cell division protein PerM n=1 Tax=Streptomyces sp. NPDC005438 TaxID=3156880 RepID=UPI0033B8CC3D